MAYRRRTGRLVVPYEHRELMPNGHSHPLVRWLADQRRAVAAGGLATSGQPTSTSSAWSGTRPTQRGRRTWPPAPTTPRPARSPRRLPRPHSTSRSGSGWPTAARKADSARTPRLPNAANSSSPRSTKTGAPPGPSTGNATTPPSPSSSPSAPSSTRSCRASPRPAATSAGGWNASASTSSGKVSPKDNASG
nr:helicase associated domain-containing protein [Streptomyces sp. NEAU-HV9]